MIESVTLVGPPPQDKAVGVLTYTDGLEQGLKSKGITVKRHHYWKRPFRMFGRDVGSVATQMLSRILPPPKADVRHAIYGNYTSRFTNVVSILDLVWQKDGYPESKLLHNFYKSKFKRVPIVTLSLHVKDQIVEWLKVSPDMVFVTPLAPRSEFVFTNKKKFSVPTVLVVGDANERKCTLEAVKALDGLDVRLLHVGRNWGDTEYGSLCVQEARKRDVDLVETGPVSVADLAHYYNQSDVLLYPSKDEGFGLPPLEAAACGLNAVVGESPVFDEVLGTACFRSDGTVESIRSAVSAALTVPIPAADLRARAAMFTWERTATETLKAYEAAL